MYNRTTCMYTLIPFKAILMCLNLCYNGVCNIGHRAHKIAQITRPTTILKLRIAMAETYAKWASGKISVCSLRWQNIACLEIMYFHFYITLML